MAEGRILFDVTKSSEQKHFSGLLRVSSCLKKELSKALGERLVEVAWNERRQEFKPVDGTADFELNRNDALLTAELFSEFERPGVEAYLKSRRCRTYAVFHDAIPLRHPEFTWPHSVQRHPSYMKMLSLFDGIFAVSQHSSIVLEEYWEWLGYEYAPSVRSLQLGADGLFEEPTEPSPTQSDTLEVLLLGIIEKRKGQDLALDACCSLWEQGYDFRIHVVGRANPYFGKEIEKRMRRLAKDGRPLVLHGHLDDEALKSLLAKMDLSLFPSRAEGCGLPVLESLWSGLPVLAAKLPSVRETSRFGGCRFFKPEDPEDLAAQLKPLLESRDRLEQLRSAISTPMLPRWKGTAHEILDLVFSAEACLRGQGN